MRLINFFIWKSAILSAVLFASVIGSASAETKLPFTLDWKFEGPSAPYFAAIDGGHFAAK